MRSVGVVFLDVADYDGQDIAYQVEALRLLYIGISPRRARSNSRPDHPSPAPPLKARAGHIEDEARAHKKGSISGAGAVAMGAGVMIGASLLALTGHRPAYGDAATGLVWK